MGDPRTKMRTRRRSASPVRTRAIPARSRMTVARKAEAAPLVRQSQLVAALRSSREALSAVEGQLEALLATLRDPGGATPDAAVADRLQGATRRAGSALASLGVLAQRR